MDGTVSLTFLILLYCIAGFLHFVYPKFYLKIMPQWLGYQKLLIYVSGVVEIGLGVLLLFAPTRGLAAWTIIGMLFLFLFLLHIPQSIDFYKRKHSYLWLSLVRVPIQGLLIWWAYQFT